MRLSTRKNDSGYSVFSMSAKAFLDGREISHVFTADEELGKLWRYITTRKGKLILNLQKNGALKECLSGRVEIKVGINDC